MPAHGPLHGVRVIDVTSMVSGPSATMLLADQGADVVKVENPAGGDHTRASTNTRNGFSANFLNNNRNKRSIALNLKRAEGVAALIRLAAGADVFIQNFRPGVAERMGIGEGSVRKAAPGIIYVSICGFGFEGPYAAKPVYDPLIQALSGLTTVQAGSDAERPRLVRTILPDKLTGMAAAQSITAALLARERTGEGQHVRLSMLDTILAFLWGSDMAAQTFVDNPFPQARAASFIDLIYETADGHVSVAVQSDREWAALARALDRPEWPDDPRFRTPALRQQNIDERLELTQDALRTLSTIECLARLEAEDVPCAPVLTRREAIAHPQTEANGVVIETEHALAGRIRQARPAARFSKTPTSMRMGGPALGEHTREILAEAGFSETEAACMIENGTAAVADGRDGT